MARYVIKRTVRSGAQIPQTEAGARFCRPGVEKNAREGVTSLQVSVLDPYFFRYPA